MGDQFELEIGEKLRLLQQRRGFSNEALARMSGISVNTLKQVLSDSDNTAHGNYKKVANALDKKIKVTVE